MGRFDNIIIISDVDGTFLGKDSRIVPQNINAIKHFTENGGKFTFISGRTPVEFLELIPQVPELANLPVGCCNGIYLYDFQNQCPLMDITLDNEVLYKAFLPYLKKNNGKTFIFAAHGSDFYGFSQKDFEFVSKFPERCHLITPEELKTIPVNKIVVLGEKHDIFPMRDEITEKYSDYFHSVHSLPYAVEYIKNGSSKASTVERIREISADKKTKIFAIGDYQNDIEMLNAADFTASSSNALPEISAITQIHVCDHDTGAIADLIRIIEEKYIG